VFQEDVLWEEKTVDENLELVGEFRGLIGDELENRKKFIKEVLILDDLSTKHVKYLSGGSKRKLCCAMALLIPPKILFLDEISNGVDPVARKNLYSYFSYLKTLKNMATLLITHRIDEAEKICDKILIMAEGKNLKLDTPENLKKKYGRTNMLRVDVRI
jgi:ABC-2 type transport system ATP-binding protein